MLNRLANTAKTWVVVGVGALVLALSAFFILSNFSPDSTFAHDAGHVDLGTFHNSDGSDLIYHVHYDENGTGPVNTFTSMDPEGARVDWDVMGTDADDFTISNGVLSFKEPPNYEAATDRMHVATDLDGDGATDGTSDLAADTVGGDNTYLITVRATERRASGYTGPAKSTNLQLTVNVNNVDEPGVVDIDWLLPEVGTTITASLTDPDTAGPPDMTDAAHGWQWYRSKVESPDPDIADLTDHWTEIATTGITQTYDPVVADEGRILLAVATYKDDHGGTADDPKIAREVSANKVREDVVAADNTNPAFGQGSTDTREVAEDAAVGDAVGDPVTATDINSSDGDIVTHAITGGADENSFTVDKADGQIRVGQRLDHELGGTNGVYVVEITATDSVGGATAPITVTITVTDVNEPPSVPSGPAEISVAEKDSNSEAAYTGIPDTNVYSATDPDALSSVTIDWRGEDASAFTLSDATGGKAIVFHNPPDFENPTDVNGDNVYKIIIVSKDGNPGGESERPVSITVTNVAEDGDVTISPVQPRLGSPVTATLSDPDGGETVVSWAWSSSDTEEGTYAAIGGATSVTTATTAAYTPGSGDRGMWLQVTVTYIDGESNTRQPLTATSANAVLAASGESNAPEFAEGESTTRSVAENTATGGNVGAPVIATDAEDDALTYTLSGDDSAPFAIDDIGQIEVNGALDHDTKNTYTFTVTATDEDGEEGSITVTVTVTDVNETPTFHVDTPTAADDYAENGTDSVVTLVANDPEGTSIIWEVVGVDGDDFSISNGVLSFKEPPNYEAATDRTNDEDGSGTLDAGEGLANNVYKITVRATETRASGYTGPAKFSEHTLTVTVTNVNEEGTVELQSLKPEVGTSITATATDLDGAMVITGTNHGWQWYRNKSSDASIPTDSDDRDERWESADGTDNDTATYTPNDADEDKFLLAQVTYTDPESSTDAKVAYGISANTVREEIAAGDNVNPAFVAGSTDTREVAEDAAVGDAVGDPVTATDLNAGPGLDDIVTHTISGTHEASFTVDKADGQIRVGQRLDHEAGGLSTNFGVYEVVITATDSGGKTATIAVTITVTDVNEPPSVTGGFTDAKISVDEKDSDSEVYAGIPDTNVFSGTDPDDNDSVALTLAGEDADEFIMSDATGGRKITFKNPPNFETPTDADGNNIYKVTVVATDSAPNTSEQPVTITVTNVEEDGMLVLMPVQPHIGSPMTATLTDEDGVETITSWQWNSSASSGGPFVIIATATTDTYTPVSDDSGDYLQITVEYTDAQGGSIARILTTTSTNAVLAEPATRNAPEFSAASYQRGVAENAPAGAIVGDPVMATDEDTSDVVTYSLGGADDGSFVIDGASGQITVGADADFDFEDKSTYVVEVTATDLTDLSDKATVNITLVDVNEGPSVPEILDEALLITGLASFDYDEGGTDAVATYIAVGPAAASASWSLTGDDAGDFRISNDGELTFATTPDYEMPMDTDMDNVYETTVTADDGTNQAERSVTVTVANMDDDGTVTLWAGTDALTTPQVGEEITAQLTDPDGNPGDALPIAMDTAIDAANITGWEWASSDAMGGPFTDIIGATSAAYTPMDTDAGMYLRAMAMYTDNHGADKTEMVVTSSAVGSTLTTGSVIGDRYDAVENGGNANGMIERSEAITAIQDYFASRGADPTKAQVIEVIALFFAGLTGS